MSRQRKRDAVLRLVRGEDLETVSRGLGVTAATLSGWRDAFLSASEASLATRATDGEALESARLKATIGASSTMQARQTCFCDVSRSATRASSRSRSEAESMREIPLRIPPDSQDTAQTETLDGLSRQVSATGDQTRTNDPRAHRLTNGASSNFTTLCVPSECVSALAPSCWPGSCLRRSVLRPEMDLDITMFKPLPSQNG
jgi:hypothetical protein